MASENPSEAELEILHILWKSAPCTVREVHEKLSAQKTTGYTTTLKQIQRMTEKNMVERLEDKKPHEYRPVLKEKVVKKNALERMTDKVFGGSAMKLVMHALGNRQSSPEEIETLRTWLDEQEKNREA